MPAILVTGGACFIGSHTCKALAAQGHTPITFDNLSRVHADLVRWGPLVKGDILEAAALDAAFDNHHPEDCRRIWTGWYLCWPDPEGLVASGLAGRASAQVRADHQRADRSDARPHHFRQATLAR